MRRQRLADRLLALACPALGLVGIGGSGTGVTFSLLLLELADQQLKLVDVAVELLRRPTKPRAPQHEPLHLQLRRRWAKHGGLSWDRVAGAEPTRSCKPQPGTYLGSAGLLGLRPEQCALVAAHDGDLRAARACGFKTAFIPRLAERGPGQATDLRADRDWDAVAAGLVDMAQRLARGE